MLHRNRDGRHRSCHRQGRRRHRSCHRHHRLQQHLLPRNRDDRRHRKRDRGHDESDQVAEVGSVAVTPHHQMRHNIHRVGRHLSKFNAYVQQGLSFRLDRPQPHQYKMHHILSGSVVQTRYSKPGYC